ncbi:PAS domain S-box protein [Leptolyngbya sp. FACHB-8]|uniref:sensor histidine kinase n=1 Tax=unclassified Leptolyngbya TaxID=2650499 RepID=UPI001682DE45|nr:PAS domain S-box protein [Leptolyngbya sp. FACHB-8]MBD1911750.1 PAS domain S-box protein [Leptolyngbya sp. FACHB-8]
MPSPTPRMDNIGAGSDSLLQHPGQGYNPEFQALVENTPDIILQIDPNLRLRYANSRITQELGLLPADMIGKTLEEVGLPEDVASRWKAAIQQVLQTGQEQFIEFDLPTRSGAFFWHARVVPELGSDRRLMSVLLISRDITRLKLAELALRESEIRYRAMLDSQVELVCRFNLDGTLTFVNDACCRLLERDRTALLGFSILTWVPANYHSRITERLAELNAHPADTDTLEVPLITPHGSERWMQWTTQSILNDNGEPIEYQAVGRDIHDRKQIEAALRQRIERERTLNRVIQVIRNSLDLNTVFSTATEEIAQLLRVDRAAMFQYLEETEVWLGRAEFCPSEELLPVLRLQVSGLNNPLTDRLKRAEVVTLPTPSPWQDPVSQEITERFTGTWVMVPLLVGSQVWGALCLNDSDLSRSWKSSEVELACLVADQLAIAIQQSQLYAEVQHLNASLERQVRVRTVQLQLAFEFEATLKRITDRVRDSLDETQILQTAVKELAMGMGVLCCNAALFDLEQGISTIRYEYTKTLTPARGRISRMADFPEIYEPLLQGQHFQFCSILDNPVRDRVSMLACPIQDNQGVLGDLWLISPSFHAYSEQDIRLVQQVANQCAIAIRQARLYQTAQAQVTELERLNSLKDDFLSTVSHELRTPMANLKIAAQMLDLVLTRTGIVNETVLQKHPEIERYFRILHDECQREISLINDLLDLSRLDAGTEPPALSSISLQSWLPTLVNAFRERACSQQQALELHVAPDLPLLTTDLSYLERIVSELLNNACKYTPSGGQIILETQMVWVQRQLTPGLEPSFGNILEGRDMNIPPALWQQKSILRLGNQPLQIFRLRVTNTGVEIPAIERDRIFEKFYRIPKNDPWRHGGTGLGLALVKKLAEQLGGVIEVDSGNNQTCLILYLVNRPTVLN